MGPRINSLYRDHLHWTGLSKDGKSLIITSMRPDLGSLGGNEEWISYQNPQVEWQEPLSLGDTINTAGEDMCRTFTPDGEVFRWQGVRGPLSNGHGINQGIVGTNSFMPYGLVPFRVFALCEYPEGHK
ncbi:hypothetical protein [Methylobacter sp. BBA5.1]|uniref:hypothetical protein n=1 Tax=Methylobacter sp. BBA5.1 TaxID=1495064 RepID=UPI001F408D14|nr:hypothetical protein [Methylobacter sp. BBA5.1]